MISYPDRSGRRWWDADQMGAVVPQGGEVVAGCEFGRGPVDLLDPGAGLDTTIEAVARRVGCSNSFALSTGSSPLRVVGRSGGSTHRGADRETAIESDSDRFLLHDRLRPTDAPSARIRTCRPPGPP